jgi:hypothetical protein
VISGKKFNAGYDGYRWMALRLPLLWLFVPVLYFPGVPQVGGAIYRWVAKNRPIINCDESCAIIEPRIHAPVGNAVGITPRFAWMTVMVSALLTLVSFGAWQVRAEYYPLSSWQMYSWAQGSEVSYYKIWSLDGLGKRELFYPNRAIGALADGRYMDHVPGIFIDSRRDLVRKVLESVMVRHNELYPDKPGTAAIEVERWKWDFVKDKNSKTRGKIVALERIDCPRT